MSSYNIAVIAEAGAGKDVVAEYLIEKYGYSRYAFADNVKLVAETWFPELYGNGKEKPRWLLQTIGTMFREIDEYVWINAMLEDIANSKAYRERNKYSKEHITITDCRMPNEYEVLKEKGYTFLRVVTDEDIRLKRLKDRGDSFKEEDLEHHTESFYNSFHCDYVIDNNGTLDELHKQIDNLMMRLSKGET